MTDRDYMLRAISLAKKGAGFTNPNPMVGAVIVKEGRIIGEGYHEKYGKLHAERNAIASLTESAQGATLYVTLEPCCHYGKTPPCTEAVIEQKIAKVVIGSRDPNPKVAGKGVMQLRQAGIEVVEDFMREECDAINQVFFHFITSNRPYVVMKYAMTADGKIATRTGASKWITGEESRMRVQHMRSRYAAIMVGIGTVLLDDPMLNVRVKGSPSPLRIVCDSSLQIPVESKIVKSAREYPTIVVCAKENPVRQQALEDAGIQVLCFPNDKGRVDLVKVMEYLGEQKIDSVFIEGGGTLNESALKAGIVSELKVFIAPKIFGGRDSSSPVAGEGVKIPSMAYPLSLQNVSQIGEDLLLEYKVENISA